MLTLTYYTYEPGIMNTVSGIQRDGRACSRSQSCSRGEAKSQSWSKNGGADRTPVDNFPFPLRMALPLTLGRLPPVSSFFGVNIPFPTSFFKEAVFFAWSIVGPLVKY